MGGRKSGDFGIRVGKRRKQEHTAFEWGGVGDREISSFCPLSLWPKPFVNHWSNFFSGVSEFRGCSIVAREIADLDIPPFDNFIVGDHDRRCIQPQWLNRAISENTLMLRADDLTESTIEKK